MISFWLLRITERDSNKLETQNKTKTETKQQRQEQQQQQQQQQQKGSNQFNEIAWLSTKYKFITNNILLKMYITTSLQNLRESARALKFTRSSSRQKIQRLVFK